MGEGTTRAHDRRRVAMLLASGHGTPLAMVASVVIALVLAPHDRTGTFTWLAIRLTLSAGMLVAHRRIERDALVDPSRTIRRLATVWAVGGVGWALLPVLVRPVEPEWRSVMLFALVGNLAIVSAGGAPHRRVFLADAIPVVAIGVPAFASFGGGFSAVMSLLLVMAGVYSWAVCENSHRVLVASFDGDQRNEDLVIELEQHRTDLHEINQRLHEMVERQSLTLEERDALVAAVAHDLRSPLAAISLLAQTLADRGEQMDVEQRSTMAERISAESRRTVEVLADLAAARRLEARDVAAMRAPIDLRALMVAAVETHDVGTHHVTVGDVPDAGRPIVADPVLVSRVLDNLVANATKHTPDGSTVTVGASWAGDDVLVHVDDDGPGLPDHLAESVFDAYVRGTSSTARPGSGVGLFLVRTFAHLHGGRAWWEPGPLGGSRFVVSLPQSPIS